MPRITRRHPRTGCLLAAALLTAGLSVTGAVGTASADPVRNCPERYVLAVDGTRGFATLDSIDPDSPLAKISARYRGPGTVVEHIDSDLLVLGYSQGASIAGDVLAEIAADGSVPPERISGILYSDPRDTSGVETLFPGPVLPGVTLDGARDEFGRIPVERICIEGDAVCDGRTPADGKNWLRESVRGYLELHTKYPDYHP